MIKRSTGFLPRLHGTSLWQTNTSSQSPEVGIVHKVFKVKARYGCLWLPGFLIVTSKAGRWDEGYIPVFWHWDVASEAHGPGERLWVVQHWVVERGEGDGLKIWGVSTSKPFSVLNSYKTEKVRKYIKSTDFQNMNLLWSKVVFQKEMNQDLGRGHKQVSQSLPYCRLDGWRLAGNNNLETGGTG